ncbi:hypothetical protein WALSEDRAFT_56322 [Wallemia mellicola CBS 633.66]|uniref:R3H domain-containing protein n=2 Tax=Wallemia mellicola TaxID=1708541 RepID=A0A4T0S4E0_9BASI|nr:hypothetical protein WALSEDRAFT_56322 [Wallemia mellicola CBS 633.66]TIB73512.1 hypothetical protein E3Q23_02975 [Wallemia mellicola]EIM23134.1 hypothetical protein WALSEDRAFT_56322 [Wallemia mellicola CBS 633.66]TIB75247.1 hypothetical protein E3Q24_00009 [Wallemia mellicola]TIB82933.1 hypothetical protein E3Q21_03167 [Wallemia mellicola]TIB85582.1 hypothetical protein E3Q20_03159 [Wallemia mellicola]|eukprot:XP_006956534.1 hypothetical protein WALSEDRAFT_56322 [Wallemia mellicola CBS 633.66]
MSEQTAQNDIRIKSQPLLSPSATISQQREQQQSYFPAILTNPKLGQLRGEFLSNTQRSKSEGYIGRRRRNIQERDSSLTARIGRDRDRDDDTPQQLDSYKSTFPSPLPPSLLPRNQPVPSTTVRGRSQRKSSSSAGDEGSFYISLKGIRKTLAPRGTGSARARFVVQTTESEIRSWILGSSSEVVINPDDNNHTLGRVIDATTTCNANGHQHDDDEECIELPSIIELSRSPSSLVWLIPEKFERFVVHCVARWWGVVSFSKTNNDGDRVTHLLKPRLPADKQVKHNHLDTPPVSEVDTASEIASETASDYQMSQSEAEDNAPANTSTAWAEITDDFERRLDVDKNTSDDDIRSNDRERMGRSRNMPERTSRAVRESDTEESDAERTSPNATRSTIPRKVVPKSASTHPWREPTVSFSEYLFEAV